jgi:hypothetical protein
MRALLLPLLLSASFAAQADSFTSSASSAGSASVASLSDSISDSSDSSSGDDDNKKSKKSKAQAGAYTVTQLARLDDGRVALRLAGVTGVVGLAGAAQHGSGEVAPAAITLTLRLPAAVAVEQDLQTGQTLHLLARPYGLAVARASDATPFFLAVDDRLRRDHESVKL